MRAFAATAVPEKMPYVYEGQAREFCAGAVPPGAYCHTPQCAFVKQPPPRGLRDEVHYTQRWHGDRPGRHQKRPRPERSTSRLQLQRALGPSR